MKSTSASSAAARAARHLPLYAGATLVVLAAAYGLAFFWAPLDADQGLIQKIFYLHVPVASVSLCAFVAALPMAAMYLRTRNPLWDVRAYVAIHLGLMFALVALLSGSIWAKASWGQWWVWDEPTLVAFLIVFLLYACYQPLRFAIDDSERQARYASVFAIVAGVWVPINFLAVRLAEPLIHPRVLGGAEGDSGLPASMAVCFVLALVGMGLLFVTLWKLEISAKLTRQAIARIRARAASGARA